MSAMICWRSSESGKQARYGEGMIALKFLARGAVGPFTGFVWPSPAGSTAGAWVESPPERFPERGIHACLVEHLPYWTDDELWEVELSDEKILCSPMQIVASRGRLVERVAAWTPRLAQEFGQACALKARDRAVELMKQGTRLAEAEQLFACRSIAELERVARPMSALSKTDSLSNIAGYVADAATFARISDVATASYIAAELARVTSGSMQGFLLERSWQGRWIADRLRLAHGSPHVSV